VAVLVEKPWSWGRDADHPGPGERWPLGWVGQVLQVVLELGEADRADAHPGLIRAAVIVAGWVLVVVVVEMPAGHRGAPSCWPSRNRCHQSRTWGGIRFRLAATHDHLVVLDQPVHRLVGMVVAEQGGDVLAELGALAVVAAQLGSAEAEAEGAEGAEGATGIDGGQLLVIADHDHLASGPIGMPQELGEFAGADHGRLINYRDTVTIEPFGPSAELPEQALDRRGWRIGFAFQLAGGRPGRRRTDDLQALAAEGIRGSAGGIGLAGAGVADHQRDPGAVAGDLADQSLLAAVQPWSGLEGGPDVLASDHRRLLAGAPFGLHYKAPLQVQELGAWSSGPRPVLDRR